MAKSNKGRGFILVLSPCISLYILVYYLYLIATINPYRYRSYRFDTETGLYYLQSRYYNPELGRFISMDDTKILMLTQGEVLGANLFAYCNNNPVMFVDPSGYSPANIVGMAFGIVIGVVGGYFLGNYLADKWRIKGWFARPAFVWGVATLVGAALGVIGWFLGPYIKDAGKSLFQALKNVFNPKIGTQIGKLGKITKNTKPIIQGLTKHGSQRLIQRGVTEALAQKIVNTGYAIAQSSGTTLYVTQAGVVVLNKAGKVVTTYSAQYFDDAMKAIIKILFG